MSTMLVTRPPILNSSRIQFSGGGAPGKVKTSPQLTPATSTDKTEISLQAQLESAKAAATKAEVELQQCQLNMRRAQGALKKHHNPTSQKAVLPKRDTASQELQEAQKTIELAEAALRTAEKNKNAAHEMVWELQQSLTQAQLALRQAQPDQPESPKTPTSPPDETRTHRKSKRNHRGVTPAPDPIPMPRLLQALSRVLPQSFAEKMHQKYSELYAKATVQTLSSSTKKKKQSAENPVRTIIALLSLGLLGSLVNTGLCRSEVFAGEHQ